jgi:hypothetical protein
MAKQTLPTRALLACGAVAGPMYVTVTMAQAVVVRERLQCLMAPDTARSCGARLVPDGPAILGSECSPA